MNPTAVIINGAKGKMGTTTVAALQQQAEFHLAACLGADDDLGKAIRDTQAKIVIDFTTPHCVFANSKTIIEHNARPVIGTTGLSLAEINELSSLCQKKSLGAIIAPNFSLGAILMMRFAKEAAKFLPNVEIIEMHHEKKLDAPSGTARKTAEMIAESLPTKDVPAHQDQARGEVHQGVTIHSVRLPGYFAHQEVLFGNHGEVLSIRHDAMSRESMMPGVILACQKVLQLDHLVYGLDQLI